MAAYPGQQLKPGILAEKPPVISPRLFGILPCRSYALADGIRPLPSGSALRPPQESSSGAQLEMAFVWSG